MSRNDVSVHVMREVIANLDEIFTTKDVSEDPRMLTAHRHLTDRRNYHSFVGGALSDHRAVLGIDKIPGRTDRGFRWQKI
jgi:hypothetical protein